MKIFVGYAYHPRDIWVEELVFPLIKAFGIETVSGKELFGESLGDGVKEVIRQSDTVIGFTTRRAEPNSGTESGTDLGGESGTHRWVTDELATAHAFEIPFVEVREKGITPQKGILSGRGYIEYEETKSAECLVKIATTVGGWLAKYAEFEWSLMPEEFARRVSPLLDDGNLKCSYEVIVPGGTEATISRTCKIIPLQHGLALRMRNVPSNSLVRILVQCGGGFYWKSTYQQVDKRLIHLAEAKMP